MEMESAAGAAGVDGLSDRISAVQDQLEKLGITLKTR